MRKLFEMKELFFCLFLYLAYFNSKRMNCLSSENNNDNININFNQLNMKLNLKIQKFIAYSNEFTEFQTINQDYKGINFFRPKDKKIIFTDSKNTDNNQENTDPQMRNIYAYYNKPDKKIEYKTDIDKDLESHMIAYGKFKRTRYQLGWDKLHIKTFASAENNNPLMQCYSAGFIEGAISSREIYYYYTNIHIFFANSVKYIEEIKKFYAVIDKNIKERIKNKNNYKNLSDSEFTDLTYLACLNAQINGLHQGYNSQAEEDKKLDLYDFYFINSEGNFGDLKSYMKVNKLQFKNLDEFFTQKNLFSFYNTNNISKIWKDITNQGHCSAIIKLIENPKTKMLDILAGHNTWSDYSEMIRVLKFHSFAFEGNNPVFGMRPKTLNFSSYPGVLFSGDDFYLLDTKIGLIQTTLNVINKFAYKDLLDMKKYIPEFMRLQITNFSSNSAVEWVNKYKSWQNHMYITQWLVIDYNILNNINQQRAKGSNPSWKSNLRNDLKANQSGLVILVEEAPRSILSRDITTEFLEKGFYGSFNISYFPEHQELVGMRHFKDVNFFDKNNNPRHYILKNLQNEVKDIESFKDLILYNGYKKRNPLIKDDPSFRDPTNGISARNDLLTGQFYGGIDFKVIKYYKLIVLFFEDFKQRPGR